MSRDATFIEDEFPGIGLDGAASIEHKPEEVFRDSSGPIEDESSEAEDEEAQANAPPVDDGPPSSRLHARGGSRGGQWREPRYASMCVDPTMEGMDEAYALLGVEGAAPPIDAPTEPARHSDIANRPDAPEWYASEKQELENLRDRGVFRKKHRVSKVGNSPITRLTWAYKHKTSSTGSLGKRKSRVAGQDIKGLFRFEGRDFETATSSAIRYAAARLLLALAAYLGLTVFQLDFTGAYLQTPVPMEKKIYVHPPPGYPEFAPDGEPLCYELGKYLYGFQESGAEWMAALANWLRKTGFKPTWVDPNVYTRATSNGIEIVGVYVDDLLVAVAHDDAYKAFTSSLAKDFVFEDNGRASFFLGLNIHQSGPHTIGFNMRAYIRRMSDKLLAGDSRPNPENPCVADFDKVIEAAEDGRIGYKGNEALVREYRRLMGSLLYAGTAGRPDVCLPVGKLCRVLTCPTPDTLKAAYHLARYLRGTADLGIQYNGGLPVDLVAYGLTPLAMGPKDVVTHTDSDWSVGPSTTAYIVMVCGGPVAWKSSKQTCTAGSSTEAELIAANSSANESVYVSNLIEAILGSKAKVTVLIRCDNQGAVSFSLHPKTISKMKHIQRDFIRIREYVESKTICIKYIDTKLNLADALSKPLLTSRFRALVSKFMGRF